MGKSCSTRKSREHPIPLGIENTGTHAEHIRIKLLEGFGNVSVKPENMSG